MRCGALPSPDQRSACGTTGTRQAAEAENGQSRPHRLGRYPRPEPNARHCRQAARARTTGGHEHSPCSVFVREEALPQGSRRRRAWFAPAIGCAIVWAGPDAEPRMGRRIVATGEVPMSSGRNLWLPMSIQYRYRPEEAEATIASFLRPFRAARINPPRVPRVARRPPDGGLAAPVATIPDPIRGRTATTGRVKDLHWAYLWRGN
jgi:hypothetical protein